MIARPAAVVCLVLAWSALTLAADRQPGLTLYVAPHGNDAHTGRSRSAGAATADGPLATLEKARDEIRRLKKAGPLPAGGVTVLLAGGIYSLPATFRLQAEDAGTDEAPIVYAAAPGEKPVVLGGKLITGFTPDSGAILKTDVHRQGFKGVYFRQLFFDGRRQHLARWPNHDPKNPYGGGWAYADGKRVPMYQNIPGETRRDFHYKPADARTWSKPEEGDVFVFPRYNWWNNIVRIASIDRDQRRVTLVADCSYPIRPGDRYYVRNIREELDAPGEWHLDRDSGTLRFWPPAPLEGRSVYAPTLRTVISLEKGVRNVTFRGLTIECCEGTAVTMTGTDHCRVAGCTIRNVGDYGGSGVSISGGTHNGVVGCDIHDVGSNGVSLSGGDRPTLTPAHNYAENNYIHHVGVFYKQGVGVAMNGVGHRAAHNLIHDLPRMGIMFSGNNLLIEYNHIRHVNLETADTGAVYTGGRDWISSRGSVIRYNYFHDILGFGDENGHWVSPHFAWGVYLDDNTGGVDVIGNIVVRSVRGLIHLHNGRDNLVENNIFVDGKLQQVEYNGWNTAHRYWADHLPTMIKGYESVASQPAWKGMRNIGTHPTQAVLPDNTIMSGNVLQRNILYYRDPAAKLYRFNRVNFDHNRSDYNLIYHFGQPLQTSVTAAKVKATTGPNLAPNPGFEAGKPGQLPDQWRWQVRPTPAAVAQWTGDAHAGKGALEIRGAAGKDPQGRPAWPMIKSDDVPARPGQTYQLTAWIRAAAPDTKALLAAQAWKKDAYSWSKSAEVKVGTQWKQYEFVFKFPAANEPGAHPQMTGFYLRFDCAQADGTLWVDDVVLQEAETQSEWEAWLAQGQDTHSLVADPLFVDPEHDDYRLRPDSPAFKLGFRPIPVEKIGPYADPLRASWPIVEAPGAREFPTVLPKGDH